MRAALALAAITLSAACGAGPQVSGTEDRGGAELAASQPLPEVLGIGREATREEIARIDIDVMPDGTGLPPGNGTAVAGGPIYGARCAACHGPEGEGTQAASALVGRRPGDAFDFAETMGGERAKTIGSYWPYATTLFDYIRRAMPFDRPGTLTADEVYSLTAWLLWKNGIVEAETTLDATTLPNVVMPAHDRFTLDDRESSDRVR